MGEKKQNCWEVLRCGREPGGAKVSESGPCPAATDAFCDGINGGKNAGRLCWAIEGTCCEGAAEAEGAEKVARCEQCAFFRRVKYEEGCHFQLLKPGLKATDPAEIHHLLNDVVTLVGFSRDIFACLAERPLLARIAEHALSITDSSSACVYVFSGSGDELVLEGRAGSLDRPQRVGLAAETPVAEAARTRRLARGSEAIAGWAEPAAIAAIPMGGHQKPTGVMELLKPGGFSVDDEWFLREFGLIASLGITNARLIEDLRELKKYDKAKSRFVAMLMHQIGSPLATIACSLQAIRQLGDTLSVEDQRELVQCALDRINSVQGLSKRLLDLAAIRSGSTLADIRPVAPAEPLRQVVESRLEAAREKGVEVALNVQPCDVRVMADAEGLRVIFANLLDNAIKYSTREEKRVDVELDAQSGAVRVSFRDRGIGIPAEEQPRIFEEFRRASNVAGSHVSGFGLGLAVVKELVERYGGHIDLESTVDVGTTFCVRFPATG